MMIFVSGSGTGVGKTTITASLAKELRKRHKIAIAKPIETGVESIPHDAKIHLQNQSRIYQINDICFYQFSLPSSPFVADSHQIIDIHFIITKLRKLERECDMLFVEGAGGLFVPITKQYFMLDLISELGAFCLLVASGNLGCINEILSARYILENKGISFVSIINVFDDKMSEFDEISYPFIKFLDRNFVYQKETDKIIAFLENKLQK